MAQALKVFLCGHNPKCRTAAGRGRARLWLFAANVDRVLVPAHFPWQLVIFDNDGVVVDSEPLAALAQSRALTAMGYPITPEECDVAYKGISLSDTRRLVEKSMGRPLPADFEQVYTANLAELMATDLRPVAGVEKVLDYLEAEGAPYCLASSSRRKQVGFGLATVGLADRFAGRWWGAEDVAQAKPAPDLFLLAARSFGVPPAGCVVIEDSAPGVAAARAAGMAALGYTARATGGELDEADATFTDMAELPALLRAGPKAR